MRDWKNGAQKELGAVKCEKNKLRLWLILLYTVSVL